MARKPSPQPSPKGRGSQDKLKVWRTSDKMSQLSGKSIIGFSRGAPGDGAFHGFNPSSGEELAPTYYSATADEVDRAAQLAGKAFEIYSRATGRDKAAFLRKIAENIESFGDELVTRATAETALPAARIKNEIARTCNQLRLFADMVEAGSWVDARIDRADPSRTPLPKPDVRSMLRPLGPVVVFCASNFPLAFSVVDWTDRTNSAPVRESTASVS